MDLLNLEDLLDFDFEVASDVIPNYQFPKVVIKENDIPQFEFNTMHPVSNQSSTVDSEVSDSIVASGFSLSRPLNASNVFLSMN